MSVAPLPEARSRGVAAGPAGRGRWRDLRPATRLCVVAFAALVCYGGAEVASRGYWCLLKGQPPFHTARLWRHFFPEWADSRIALAPARPGATCDVLLLGGSVLHEAAASLEARLGPRLAAEFGRPVRVINLAYPGRTTRDTRFKYERLGDRRFDLVVVYDAINDAFLNSCPPGTFRADYAHARRFADLRSLDRHPEVGWTVLPLTAELMLTGARAGLGLAPGPCPAWGHYAADVRTAGPYEDNLAAVAAEAARRGDPLLLMTFASHIPADYSEEAFAAGRLDYDGHRMPARLWGEARGVARAIELHNAALRRVAARYGTLFIDLQALLPPGRRYFTDPCHLNAAGNRLFAENVVAHLELSRVGRRPPARAAAR